MRRIVTGLVLLAASVLPTAAFAHTGVGAVHGFGHGFLHPLLGPDHLLAMVAVGVIAWQLGGRALWALPATFVVTMAAAGVLAMEGIQVPAVEFGVALSVIGFGGLLALGLRMPAAAAFGIVGLFAVFHGQAHGAELPAAASAMSYAVGFMVATAVLHASGIGLGYLASRLSAAQRLGAYRVAGGSLALAGAGFVAALIG